MTQNRAWIVAGIFHKTVCCGLLVFAKDTTTAYRRAFNALGRIEKARIENDEMKLVVEEITDFNQVFSLKIGYGGGLVMGEGRV